jgi:hypothetical protein
VGDGVGVMIPVSVSLAQPEAKLPTQLTTSADMSTIVL